METIYINRARELKENLQILEKKLKVKIKILGPKVTISGESLDEYEALIVLEAIKFGFPAETALMLKEEDVVFRIIPIKQFTRRKNLAEVKARIIGTQGRTKRTMENLADCSIVIMNNEIGVICSAEEVEDVTTAIANLIRGSKQSNVYKFLEKINTRDKI